MYYSRIKTPAVIAAGFVVFLVANIIFYVNICNIQYGQITGLQLCILFVAFSIEICFILYSTSNFIRGLKQHVPELLHPWLGIKVVEICVLIFGTTSLTYTTEGSNSSILIATGFIALIIGLYIVFYVWIIYKNMKKNSQIPYIVHNSPVLEYTPESENPLPELEYPPSYEESQESHRNQTSNTENKY